ncbi:MAG: PhoH family protein [Armatimonadetes bacterium]|nr:PhoH family protein [Armatimonadota bacterium]
MLGHYDENLRLIEKELHARIVTRENSLHILGGKEQVERTKNLLSQLLAVVEGGKAPSLEEVSYIVDQTRTGNESVEARSIFGDVILVSDRGKKICPKTEGQKRYVEAVRGADLVFSIGPAGTGKTYLAMAMAVAALKAKTIARVILTRPAVEAGERLGFLPGDIQEKVDPYLRPLYDALYDMLDADKSQRYIERRIIEVAPLAYMRGRTLNDSFIILDEAQNTTAAQMKMFLTRMGFGSKVVVTGDVTQIDLPKGTNSGLKEAQKILNRIPEVPFVELTDRDVVRHKLVQKIILAYEEYENPEKET